MCFLESFYLRSFQFLYTYLSLFTELLEILLMTSAFLVIALQLLNSDIQSTHPHVTIIKSIPDCIVQPALD